MTTSSEFIKMITRDLTRQPEQSTIGKLDAIHRKAATRAVNNVLGTEVAHITYAQIIDGLPLRDIAWDTRGSSLNPRHPINLHTQLCPGAESTARSFRDDLDIAELTLDARVVDAFQRCPAPSRSFDLRLLELVSSTVHQIGVLLRQLQLNMHDPSSTGDLDVDAVTAWERPPDNWARFEPVPTLFIHTHFAAHEKYTNGVADMIGYWAENRILGGVLLFDRSRIWNDETNPEPNAYIEAGRNNVTFRICQLLDSQQDELLRFLSADKSQLERQSADGPLPVLSTPGNRVRVEPTEAVPVHMIYRHTWEREDPPEDQLMLQQFRQREHMEYLDYPELGTPDDIMRQIEEASRRSPIP